MTSTVQSIIASVALLSALALQHPGAWAKEDRLLVAQESGHASQTGGRRQSGAATKKAYDFSQSVSVQGTNRIFHVHVPASYDRTKPTPVLLVFHGLHMTGKMMILLTGFNSLSDKRGFIVVYPEGLAQRWDDGRGGTDDVGFVHELLNRLAAIVNVDQRRIYACGISNGGYFSQVLACESNRIAAVGVVAAGTLEQMTSRCHNNKAVPIVFFLGDEDPLIAWGADNDRALGELGELVGLSGLGSINSPIARHGGVMTVGEAINFWVHHNNCSQSPYTQQENDKANDGTRVKRETYSGPFGSDVVLYTVQGGGHTWPGALPVFPKALTGRTSQDINASELIWDFFERRSGR